MPDDRTPFERSRPGPPGEPISETPARAKPSKLPNTPINGFGQPAGTEDGSDSFGDEPISGGTVAGTPLEPGMDLVQLELREQQNLNKLRDLMRVMMRALKAKRMYPANNPLLQRILGECSIAFNETLETLGDIHLTIQQFDILFLNQSIYHNPNKRESLAFRFAKDGITELVFQEGLPPDQLEDFLAVMAHAMELGSLEDDLVTLLWEQEFSHITYAYLAIDDLQEQQGAMALDITDGAEMSWPESTAEPIDETTGVPWTEHHGWTDDGGSGHRADDWNELVPVARVENRCSNDFLHLTSQEIEALAEEIHREHSRSLHDVVLEILTEVAEDESAPEAFADLARAFADLLIVVVQEADLKHAVEIAATLKTLSASRGHDPSGFLPDARDLTTQAVAGLSRHPEADASLLPEFLVHLGPRAIDPVCDLIVDVDLHSLHVYLQEALVELAKQDLPAVRSRVDLAPPHAARLLVQVLARVGTPEAEQALAAATSHIEARVRKEAISALSASGNALTRAYLLRALDDDDPQVRAAALHAVRESYGAASEDRALSERLLAVLGGPRFAEQSQVERRAYFDTLVDVGGPTVLATLDAWLGLWRLGGGGDLKARRELAAWALSRMRTPEGQAVLQKHSRSLIPAIRAACRRALETSQDLAA
ncbi:MAG: HEAT repeat domain-containing protein [Candidatus Eiseniibacteriota bacterium]